MVKQAVPTERTGSVRDQFVNLPLCVRMVADFVRDGGTSVLASRDEPGAAKLPDCHLRARRDATRIGHPGTGALTSFQDMALTYEGVNPEFSIEDLALTPSGFAEEDLERAADHALVHRATLEGGQRFTFRYEFIAPFLRAAAIAQWIQSPHESLDELPQWIVTIAEREGDGRGEVLEQLLNFLSGSHFDPVMAKARLAAGEVGQQYMSSFFFHIAQSLIDEHAGLTKKERANKLLLGLPDSRVFEDIHSG